MGGEIPAEPDRQQPDAVYPPDAVCFQMEHRGQLLRTENILVIVQIYGAQPKRDWDASEPDQHLILRMKILPYQDKAFYKYQTESVQEFRSALSEQIRQQIFYAIFLKKVETYVKSNVLINALKQLIWK